jgi:hypothetical protein
MQTILEARGHDFPDQRIAEFDDALEEVALVLFDDPLLGAGLDAGAVFFQIGAVDPICDPRKAQFPGPLPYLLLPVSSQRKQDKAELFLG